MSLTYSYPDEVARKWKQERDEFETENQKLRALLEEMRGALQKLNNEAVGLLSAHEYALSMDGGNSNMECLKLRLDKAREALAKYDALLDARLESYFKYSSLTAEQKTELMVAMVAAKRFWEYGGFAAEDKLTAELQKRDAEIAELKKNCVPWRGRGGDVGKCIHEAQSEKVAELVRALEFYADWNEEIEMGIDYGGKPGAKAREALAAFKGE